MFFYAVASLATAPVSQSVNNTFRFWWLVTFQTFNITLETWPEQKNTYLFFTNFWIEFWTTHICCKKLREILISSSYQRRNQISMLYHIRDHILSPAQIWPRNDPVRPDNKSGNGESCFTLVWLVIRHACTAERELGSSWRKNKPGVVIINLLG